MSKKSGSLKRLHRSSLLLIALFLFSVGLLPLLGSTKTDALGQIAHRALAISSGVPGATGVSYTFTFKTVATTSPIAGVKLIACDTAIGSYVGGTCNPPSGLDFSGGSYTSGSQAGFTDATAFAFDPTGAGDCTASANVICINRTSATNDTQTSTDKTLAFSAITNPSTANSTFYVGIVTYGTNNYTSGSRVDSGTVASAVVQTLTVNAAVSEILNFCIGSTLIDDAITSVASDCAGVSGTSINLGTLDSSTVNVSPWTTNGGDSSNGVAMLRTNAVNGATISYDAIQQTGTNHQGTLRIAGSSCNAGTVSTDSCINAAGTSQTAFAAGTEKFGMTVAGVNCGSTTSYTCTFSTGAYNLVRDSNYDGLGSNTYGSSNAQGYAWDESGTAQQIASSSTVVDDEALILKFAATPSITTPFGSYAAQSDYIAVATF